MSVYAARLFSRPEALRGIHLPLLLRFLRPYRQFLGSRGLALPDGDGAVGSFDYHALNRIVLAPEDAPGPLLDALYLVDEMATDEGMDALVEVARARGVALPEDVDLSPADVAVLLWLDDPDACLRKHAELQITRAKSFESFHRPGRPRPALGPTPARVAALEAALGDWFAKKKRGPAVRVFVFPRPDGTWFLVRHGEPFKREESLQGAEPAGVCYRPLKYDIVVFHALTGELRINARSKGEKQLYRTHFGVLLFDDDRAFPGDAKYTLEPLRSLGAAALSCADVDGIEKVTLREAQFYHPGEPDEIRTRRSSDLFARLEMTGQPFPEEGRIIRASFEIKFSGYRSPRVVTVRPGNVAQYTRDEASAPVEAFLKARGFIVDHGHGEGNHDALGSTGVSAGASGG